MPQYVIGRTLPGAGRLSPTELRGIAQKSNSVIRELGPDIQWVQSYVVDDKLYCIYYAKNPEIIREHARCGGFPADRITAVATILTPVSGEA